MRGSRLDVADGRPGAGSASSFIAPPDDTRTTEMSSDPASPRVVSLLPSATEIVAALGVDPVATSHECDHPPSVAEAPSVVESRIDASASSAEIDEQVRRSDAAGGVYRIDREALAEADPDLVISQGICEVCAVDTVIVEDAIEELGLDCELLTTDPHSIGDILADIEAIGEALGRSERAWEFADELRTRIDRVSTAAAESPIRPEIAVLDWLEPPMVAGHWVPELVELAGGEYGLAGHKFALHDGLVHVPLVTYGLEGVEDQGDNVVQHIDVIRTLFSQLGVENDQLEGLDLTAETRQYAVTQRSGENTQKNLRKTREYNPEYTLPRGHLETLTAVRSKTHKLLYSENKTELFALPDESTDVKADREAVFERMTSHTEEWLFEHDSGVGAAEQSGEVDARLQEHLSDMGYLV